MNIDKLLGVIPAKVVHELPAVIDKYQINTPLRLAHFLAQCAHESGNFKHVEENLMYSAGRLTQVFPRHFPTLQSTKGYAAKPELIANKVYAGRIGNGTEKSGDGWRYRGRGYIQLTNKVNYIDFAKSSGVDAVKNPGLVATDYPLLSAAWFWRSRGLNIIADSQGVKEVTKRVNGGYNGLKEREAYFNKMYNLLA